MLLYALCINPLINIINQTLPGITIGRHTRNTSVTVYVDDVTIFLTSPADIPKLQEAITSYENASGAKTKSTQIKSASVEVIGQIHKYSKHTTTRQCLYTAITNIGNRAAIQTSKLDADNRFDKGKSTG
jgi:hypothetical protein